MPLQITTTIQAVPENMRFVQDTLIVLGYNYADLFFLIKDEYFSFIIGVHPPFAEIDLQNYQAEINRRIDSERTLVTGVFYLEKIPKSLTVFKLESVLRNRLSESMRSGVFTLDLFNKIVASPSYDVTLRAQANKDNILRAIRQTEYDIIAAEAQLAHISMELQTYPAPIVTPLSPVAKSALAFAFYQPRFKPAFDLTESETAEVLHHHEHYSIYLKKERSDRADQLRHHPRKKTAEIKALNLSDSTSSSSEITPLFPYEDLCDKTSPQVTALKKFNMTKARMMFQEHAKISRQQRNKQLLLNKQFYLSQQIKNLKVILGRQKQYYSITVGQNARIAYEKIMHDFYDFICDVRSGKLLIQDWKKYFLQLHRGELPAVQIHQSPLGKSEGVIVEISRVVKDLDLIPERFEEINQDIALVHAAIKKDIEGTGLPACFSSEVEIVLTAGNIKNASFSIEFSHFKLTSENRDVVFDYIHEKLFNTGLAMDYSLAGITCLDDNLDSKPEIETDLRRMRP